MKEHVTTPLCARVIIALLSSVHEFCVCQKNKFFMFPSLDSIARRFERGVRGLPPHCSVTKAIQRETISSEPCLSAGTKPLHPQNRRKPQRTAEPPQCNVMGNLQTGTIPFAFTSKSLDCLISVFPLDWSAKQ